MSTLEASIEGRQATGSNFSREQLCAVDMTLVPGLGG
eukprot:COSAG06_NODE_62243_length_265_cov_1.192771_1_plen_36_part_01